MKKLMKKKVNVFGKDVSLLAIFLIGMSVLATAALLPYFGLITGHVTVTQGLLVDNLSVSSSSSSGSIVDAYSAFTSVQSPVYVKLHELENHAEVQGDGSIVSHCSAATSGNNCNGINYRAVEYFDSAKADFSGYTHPTCTTTVTSGGLIQTAIDSAAPGTVVCVPAGTYAEDVNVNKDITLVALNSPDSSNKATITGTVKLSVSDATLKGFDIFSGAITGKYGVYVTAGDTTVDSNIIRDITGNGANSVDGVYIISQSALGMSNIDVTNNLIQNITNTGKGANGVMIQGNLNGVNVTYNTIKDISTTNSTHWWDYAMGIQDTPSSSLTASPTNLVIEYNTLDNITSVKEPGRGFGVDEYNNTDNGDWWWADASQVTLKYNNFLNISNDLTNKDQDTSHTLIAKENYFDALNVNVNGVAKDETGAIDATWMTKTNFNIVAGGVDKFGTFAGFPKMLVPDTYTVTTKITG